MAAKPKPYKKGKFYCTSYGGTQHQKLCRIEEGLSVAEKALARLIVEYDDASLGRCNSPANAGMSVEKCVQMFLDMKKVEKSAGTFSWFEAKLKAFRERFGSKTILELTLKDGLSYKQWLSKEKQWVSGSTPRKGLGTVSVNHHIRAAKTLLNWACKPSRRQETGLWANPWIEIGLNPEKGRERLITDEEFSILLAQCQTSGTTDGSTDLQDILVTLRYTTMRPGELRVLKWGHINWSGHSIHFPADVIKVRKKRSVTLLDRVQDLLLERRKRLLSSGAECKQEDFVFSQPAKGVGGKRTAGLSRLPISANSLSQKFRRLFMKCVELGLIKKEVGGERISPYNSRHTRVSELVTEGHQQSIIMQEAGHLVPATTLKYIHLQQKQVSESIRNADQKKAQ